MTVLRGDRGAGMTILVGSGPVTPPALGWADSPETVVQEADALRISLAPVVPHDAHEALARLQQAMGARRCVLLTQAVDGLLQKAAAADVMELSGSLWRLRCERDPDHPRVGVFGPQDASQTCSVCSARLRPDVQLADEPPEHMPDAHAAVARSRVFLAMDADVDDPVVAALLQTARQSRTRLWEVHRHPSPHLFDQTLAQAGHRGIPRLVRRWLKEEAT